MSRHFQYCLSSLLWLTTVVAVNCVTLPPVYDEFVRLFWSRPTPGLWCGGIESYVTESGFDEMPPEEDPLHWLRLPPPEWPDPPIPAWQPTELTYLNDDDTITVELVGDSR